MIEVLTLIALWCGVPLPNGRAIPNAIVNKCRAELVACLGDLTERSDNYREWKAWACVKDRKLK
jgi:hypothetical protein